MDNVQSQSLQTYCLFKEAHKQAFLLLTRIKADVGKEKNLESATDAIGVLKRTADLAKDFKMEIEKCVDQLERVVCALYLRAGNLGEPIRGDWVTGSPGAVTKPKLPSRKDNPVEYAEMLRSMGASEDMIANDLLRPHYPSMMEYLDKREADAKPLPAHVDGNISQTEYNVRCLFHRGIDLDALCQGEA